MSATCSFFGGFSGYGEETVFPFTGFKNVFNSFEKQEEKRKAAMWGGKGVGQASLCRGFLTILLKNVMRHYRPALLFHGLANYISHGWIRMKWKWFDLGFLLFQTIGQETGGITKCLLESLLLFLFTTDSVFFRIIHYVLPCDPGVKSIKTAIYSANVEASR